MGDEITLAVLLKSLSEPFWGLVVLLFERSYRLRVLAQLSMACFSFSKFKKSLFL